MNTVTYVEDAVFIQNDQVKTSSLKVAELFGKQHKNVLQKLESLDCSSEFNGLNFQLVEYLDSKSESRPMYEMTKDGFIFLVMGFTGAAAAKIKEAYINTFNQMAAILYNNDASHQQIHEGAVVQLKSGGPLYTISKIFYDQNGFMQNAEVIWHNKANLCREVLPINCLTLESKNLIQHKTLDDFWTTLQNFGIGKLNHSRNPNILALNLLQVYQCTEGLPPKNQLSAILMHSRSPYPIYMQHNHAVSSVMTNKTVKCWIFDTRQHHVLEHKH
ncbi:Rha family transcriptional regulator [Acinetobacter pittii]|uniref:Rha family transcriptional regulator n=1 Tax=Acinetobacter calcoaceticus/baumannii complex TaxID=909768 RepID=UPI00045120EA|nr:MULTISPECIES: Rha family transcriptional regulator [Acinetobacter calcoaceticus/baumannii complex]EXG33058.1 phage regulatory, Rha family protein [Acinetobacter sp. 263903-2]OTS02604.1 Rha family transcriptional regulator [Acinetobacter pittii]